MNWNKHSELEGLHAYLSGSKYHWLNYTKEQLYSSYHNLLAAQRGTELHETASRMIKQGIYADRTTQTLNMFVNDAIDYHMRSEQILYFSHNAFGTADAISFRKEKGILTLRIHDLKTGNMPTHMEQLMIYAAYFCLEYNVKPKEIQIILRIYQKNDIFEMLADPEKIQEIMDKTVEADKLIDQIIEEEGDDL